MTDPLRDPAPGDRRLMGRRALWLVGLHLLLPGAPQVVAGDRRLGRFGLRLWLVGAALAVVAVGLWFLLPQLLLTVPTNAVGLTVIQLVVAAWAVWWLVLSIDTLRLARLARLAPVAKALTAVVLTVALVAGLGAAGWAAWAAGVARGTIGTVFGSGRYAMPVNGRYNILLLGGDAGKDRLGLRPDSISVVSLDVLSGRMVTLGLPREQDPIPFVAGSPMKTLYPDGYGAHGRCNVDVCQLNSIYTEAQLKEQRLYPDAAAAHTSAGIEATKEAVEGALGITIQYSVLVNMGSFDNLIDAMGGVTIDVTQRIPLGGHIVNGKLTGVKVWIPTGVHHLNGNRALWYARSRYGDAQGDYGRMQRQRQLEEAMLHQMNPITLLTRFDKVAKAGSDTVSTDIPEGLVGVLAGLAVKARGQKATNLEFIPSAGYDPTDPDYTKIHAAVAKALS